MFHAVVSTLTRNLIRPLWHRFRGIHIKPNNANIQALGHADNPLNFYQQVLDEAAIFAITDVRGTITYVNDQFCHISGYSREELIGQNHRIVNSGQHPREFFRQLYKTITAANVWHGEVCNRNKSGELYWVDTTIVPITNERGRVETYLVVRFDMTQHKIIEQRLKRLAEQDPLTGLVNRAVMTEQIAEAWASNKSGGKSFALFFLDYDRFKYINDSLGHHVGDQLLCTIADHLRQWVGNRGIVARMGGDEFVILLRKIQSIDHAFTLAAHLSEHFDHVMEIGEHQLTSTASIGVSHSDHNAADADELMRNADLAMYAAKTRGRGQACLFDREMYEKVVRRLKIESELRLRKWDQQFRLTYQPIMDLRTGKVYGLEALARWDHPTLGPISPEEFIAILEEIRLIVPFGAWVLRTACQQLAQWDKQLPSEMRPHMNVNLAKCQMSDPHLIGMIRKAIGDAGISADRLTLEVTESSIVDRADHVEEILQEIKQLGVLIAMDDFGTGASSLSLLHQFPIDILKIDRSFVWSLEQCRELMAVIQSIADLARNLNMRVVAEGVETVDHVAILQALDCDQGQGYYFAKPLEVDAVMPFLTRPSAALRQSA